MSYISDYKVGAMTEQEYKNECAMENRRERMERYLEWCERYYPDGEFEEESEDEKVVEE